MSVSVICRAHFFLTLVFLFACNAKQEPPALHHHAQFFALGTTVDVDLYDVSEEKKQIVLRAILDDLHYIENAWNPYKEGALGRVNKLLSLEGKFHTSVAIIKLLEAAKPLSEKSEGLFNPTIGRLVMLWGFHTSELPSGPPPDAKKIEELVDAGVGLDDIEISGTELNSKNAKLFLDFGGYAKGYGIDRIVDHLRELGVKNAIINVGGDLRVIGSKGDKPWKIAIKHPRESGILASINVQGDESIVTSGDYERFYEYQGRRYHHVFDPRTGYPTEGIQSVTVLHNSAATADAVATALMVAGPKRWPEIARAMGAREVMVVDAKGQIQLTPSMEKRITFKMAPKMPIKRVSLD